LPFISRRLTDTGVYSLSALLNNYCFNHEGYDALMIVDRAGNIIGINRTDRAMNPFPQSRLSKILGRNISNFPEENELFLSSIAGVNSSQDWYRSEIAKILYDYGQMDQSYHYNIALSVPIRNPENLEVMGVWINILNWSYFQKVLDNVEVDLASAGFHTGYGMMLAEDANTVIGHRHRLNRLIENGRKPADQNYFYGSRLIEDGKLQELHDAIMDRRQNFEYRLYEGGKRIAGFAPIDDTSFGWIVGVEIDEADSAQPIKTLIVWLLGGTVLLLALIVLFTYLTAERIAVPLKNLIRSAMTIAQGNFNQRVPITSSDEVGMLASAFNDMARALSAREKKLQNMAKNLETTVRDRTLELENSHEALKRAYCDLQNAQEQLIQTEKMASLGQLVSGIAHEIKNPLNFIYGNTGFLAEYTNKLQCLVEKLELCPSISEEDREEIRRYKEAIHYSFMNEDLKILIDNFSEGARRINAIVSDLRTFSRMDAETVSEVDIHMSLEMSLNLLTNQHKNRVMIHKQYGDIPKIKGYTGKLNQVFMNLLSNAFQSIRDKGDVWIRTDAENGMVEIEIEDNGSGIPAENLKRIFEPFFSTKPVGQGTGLGLSISYGIIEQHQGNIRVASTPMKGSVFAVRLPVFRENNG
ncbi:MAG TPA: ATP-binding protein, partial [Acidobacteriota bacterium]|nr:ATP-binding protein [Acidobacteriota bacterium]